MAGPAWLYLLIAVGIVLVMQPSEALAQPGVTISPLTLDLDEGGPPRTYGIRLNSAPSGTATVSVTVPAASHGKVRVQGPTGSPGNSAQISFNSSTWSDRKLVTVHPVLDSDTADETVVLTHSVTGYGAVTSGPNVTVTVDDAGSGLVVSTKAVTMAWDETFTYTIRLGSTAFLSYLFRAQSSNPEVATVDGSQKFFRRTTAAGSNPKSIRITAKAEGTTTISHTCRTTGNAGCNINVGATITVTVTDDRAYVTVSAAAASVSEGDGSGNFVLGHEAQPPLLSDLTATLNVSGSDSFLAAAQSGQRTAPLDQATGSGTLTINLVDDDLDEPDGTVSARVVTTPTHRASTSDGMASFAVTDDDPTTVSLSPTADLVLEEADASTEAAVTLQLGRDLITGEIAEVPLVLTSSTGAVLAESDPAERDFVLAASGTGVSVVNPNTATPSVRFTGGAGTEQSATLRFTATSREDPDTDNESIRVGLPADLNPAATATNLGGGLAADAENPGGNAVTLTIADTTTPGLAIEPRSLSLDELGVPGEYTVALKTMPAGTVTVIVTSQNPNKVMASPGKLTFTTSGATAWNLPQTVVVRPAQDGGLDDDTVLVRHSVTGYGSVASGPDVSVTVSDNGTVYVSPTELYEGETVTFSVTGANSDTCHELLIAGGSATGRKQGESSVTGEDYVLSLVDTTGCTGMLSTNSGITSPEFTIEGKSDSADEDDETIRLSFGPSGGKKVFLWIHLRDGSRPTGDGTIPSPEFSSETLAVSEGGPAATYTVKLPSDPPRDVTLSIGVSNPNAVSIDTDSGRDGSQSTLSFTSGASGNWGTPQSVSVSALHDDNGDNETVTLDHRIWLDGDIPSQDGQDGGTVTVAVTDLGHGVEVDPATVSVHENDGVSEYNLRLVGPPSGPVVVTPTVSGSSTAGIEIGGALTFNSANWRNPQPISVTGKSQGVATITHAVTSSGDLAHYPLDLAIDPVSVSVIADTRPTLSVVSTGDVTEGSPAGFTISLSPAQTGNVVFTAVVSQSGSVARASSLGSSDMQILPVGTLMHTVPTTDDAADEPDGSVTLTLVGTARSVYQVGSANQATAAVSDNDPTSLTLARAGTEAISENGGTESITISLGRELTAGESVTIPLTVSGAVVDTHFTLGLSTAGGLNTGVGLLTTAPYSTQNPAVTITGAGAQTASLVLTAVRDGQPAERTVTVSYGTGTRAPSVTGSTGGITLVGSPVTVPLRDTDRVFRLEPVSLTVSENGMAGMYTVALGSDPGSNVTVTVSVPAADQDAVTVQGAGGVAGASAVLTFTSGNSGNWNQPQQVTVTAIADADTVSETVVLGHARSSDTESQAGVTVNVVDAGHGVMLSHSSLSVRENAGTTKYTVHLLSQPQGAVTIAISSNDESKADVHPSAISFQPAGWITPQEVTVTGEDSGTATISHSISAGDGGAYIASLPISSVAVKVTKDPRPRVNILTDASNRHVVEGDTANVWVHQGALRRSDYPLQYTGTASNPEDFTVQSTFPFAPPDVLQVALTNSVGYDALFTAISDSLDEPNETAILTLTGVPSNFQAGSPLQLTIIDQQPTTVTLSRTGSEAIDEAAGIAEFTVSLGRALVPGEQVTAPLRFRGDGISTTDFAIRRKAGAGLNAGVSLASGGPYSATMPAVEFGAGAQVATLEVVSVDDDLYEGDSETLTLRLASPISNLDRLTGTGTGGTTASGTVTVEITDDDDPPPGVILSPTSLTLQELAESKTYTVVLSTDPGRDVTVRAVSSKPDVATVWPDVLTFQTSGDTAWDQPQTITVTPQQDSNGDADALLIRHQVDNYPGVVTAPHLAVTVTDRTAIWISPRELYEGETRTFTIFGLPSDSCFLITGIGGTANPVEGSNKDFDTTYVDTADCNVYLTSFHFRTRLSTKARSNPRLEVAGLKDDRDEGDESIHLLFDNGDRADITLRDGPRPKSTGGTFVLQPTKTVLVNLPEGGPAETIGLRVSNDPVRDVRLRIENPNTESVRIDTDIDEPGFQTQMVFTGGADGNWNTHQSIEVTALPDPDGEDDAVSLPVYYRRESETLERVMTLFSVITKDVGHGVQVGTNSVTVRANEGTSSYGLRLLSKPSADVVITASSSVAQRATVSGPITFTPEGWRNTRTVTVTGGLQTGSLSISHAVTTSSGTDYPLSTGIDPVAVSVTPDTRPTVSVTAGGGVTEGDPATFTVAISPPQTNETSVLARVTAPARFVDSGDTGEKVLLIPAAGSVPVEVPTRSDAVDEAGGAVALVLSGTPVSRFQVSSTSGEGSVSVMDDDITTVTLERVGSGPIPEDGSDAAEFTVKLGRVLEAGETVTAPLAIAGTNVDGSDYDVRLKAGSGLNAGVTLLTTAPYSTDSPALQFGAGARTATLELLGQQDAADEGSSETVTVGLGTVTSNLDGVSGTGATRATGTISIRITDDDGVATDIRLSVDPGSVPESSSGEVITVTAALVGGAQARPVDETVTVSVGASGDAASEGTDYASVDDFSLTIPAGAKSASETFTLAPVEDELDETDELLSVTGTATGLTVESAPLTITDNDSAGVTLAPGSLTVQEGDVPGTPLIEEHKGTYTVVLDSKPSGSVSVTAVSDDEKVATVSPAKLDFGESTWNTPQPVTVTGVDDAGQNEGGSRVVAIRHTVVAPDTEYAGVSAGSAEVMVVDDDVAETSINLALSATTVAEGVATAPTITVTLTVAGSVAHADAKAVTVAVGAAADTATEGVDYSTVNDFTITIPAGVLTAQGTFTLDPADDAEDEVDEVMSVSGSAEGFTVSQATLTILDDDTRGITVAPQTLSVAEVDDPLTMDSIESHATYEVVLASAPTAEVTIVIGSEDETTVKVTPEALAFDASDWNIPQQVTVAAVDDSADNPGDMRAVNIDHVVDAEGSDYDGETVVSVTATVTDNDAAPTGVTLSVDPAMVAEDAGATTITLTATVNGGTTYGEDKSVTVDVGAAADSATEGTDYSTVAAFTIDVPAGMATATATFSLGPIDDDIVEASESISVTGLLSGVTVTSTSLSVVDNDERGVSVAPTEVTVAEAGGTATYTVALTSEPVGGNVTVTVASGDETAATVSPPSLTFTAASWSTAQTVTVTGVDDALDNTGDQRQAMITHAVSATGTDYATGVVAATVGVTVTDDDGTPVLQISDPSVAEGDSGTADLGFVVTLVGLSSGEVTVGYAIAGGTAISGVDYQTLPSGTLTFAMGGSATQTVTVKVIGDTVDESNETVILRLSSPVNAGLHGGVTTLDGTGTIQDNDSTPVTELVLTPASIAENGGSSVVTATLSAVSSEVLTLEVSAAPGTGVSEDDFELSTDTTLTIAAGSLTSTGTVTVTAVDNDADTDDKSVEVTAAASGGNGVEAPAAVTLTIEDDDERGVSVAPAEVTVTESGGTATYTVALTSEPVGGNVTVTVDSGDATAATVAPGGLTFTVANWSTAQTVTVTGVDDALDNEGDEREVTISHAVSAADTDYATGIAVADVTVTVTDDDDAPVLQISDPSVAEGDSGTADLDFVVTLVGGSSTEVTVGYAVAGGTATSGVDYQVLASGILTFASGGVATQTVTVKVSGDTAAEDDETVILRLSSAVNADLQGGVTTLDGTGTIQDDDGTAALSLVLTPASIAENGGSSAVTAKLVAALSEAVTLEVSAAPGTGASSSDFALSTQTTLTIAAGALASTGTVTLTAVDNDVVGADKTVTVSASASGGDGVVAPDSVTLTIVDDDERGVSVAPTEITVAEAGGTATYTVALTSEPVGGNVTVTITSGDETAATVAPASITFTETSWSTTQTVTVTGVDDEVENVGGLRTVTISNTASGAGTDYATGVAAGSVTAAVTDDDGLGTLPVLSIDSPITVENDSGTVPIWFTVTLSPASEEEVTVHFADTGTGTATVEDDYHAFEPGILTFAPGDISKRITIAVYGDTDVEPDETIIVQLSSPSGATFTGGVTTLDGTGTIYTDDHPGPLFRVGNASAVEGQEVQFTLSRGDTDEPISVTWTSREDPGAVHAATAGQDFVATGGALVLAADEDSGSFSVPTIADDLDEPSETFLVDVDVSVPGDTLGRSTSRTVRGTIVNRKEPEIAAAVPSVALWTDELTYLPGEDMQLHVDLNPRGDERDWSVFAYLGNVETGERQWLDLRTTPARLNHGPVDIQGQSDDGRWARQLPRIGNRMVWAGPVPEPGHWHFVMELRSPRGTQVLKRAFARFSVMQEHHELIIRKGHVRRLRADMHWRSDREYLITGSLVVPAGVTLRVDAGTHVRAWGSEAHIVVEPGGRIVVQGRRELPVVMTCAAPLGQRHAGCWGGLHVFGEVAGAASRSDDQPANTPGTVPNPVAGVRASSGQLRYLRVEFAGAGRLPGGGAAALSLHSAGSTTVLEHVQVHASMSEGFLFRGGDASCRRCVSSDALGAGFAWDSGWQGWAQDLFVQQRDGSSPAVRAIGPHEPDGSGRPMLYNATLIAGRTVRGEANGSGVQLVGGAAVSARNIIASGFRAYGLEVDAASAEHFDQGESSVRNSILYGNWLGPVSEGVARNVELLRRMPRLLDVRRWPNPDPRPRTGSAALVPANVATPEFLGPLSRESPFVGAFGAENWLEGWTWFGDEGNFRAATVEQE